MEKSNWIFNFSFFSCRFRPKKTDPYRPSILLSSMKVTMRFRIIGLANSEQLAINFKIPMSKNSFKNATFKALKKPFPVSVSRVLQLIVQNISPMSDADSLF